MTIDYLEVLVSQQWLHFTPKSSESETNSSTNPSVKNCEIGQLPKNPASSGLHINFNSIMMKSDNRNISYYG